MADNTITLVGNLTDDPELRYTPNGVAVANFRIAVNRRTRNSQTNEWEDKLDGYFTINVWRDYAENVAESLTRGARVMIQGRLQSRSYEDREGQTRWVTEIEADEIAPTLKWATAKPQRTQRTAGGGGANGGGANGRQPTDTGWGGAAPVGAGAGAGASAPPSADDVPF